MGVEIGQDLPVLGRFIYDFALTSIEPPLVDSEIGSLNESVLESDTNFSKKCGQDLWSEMDCGFQK